MHLVQTADDHDYERLEEQPFGVDHRPMETGMSPGSRDAVDQANEFHQDGVLGDHGGTSEESVLGHSLSAEARCARSSPLTRLPIYDQASASLVPPMGKFLSSLELGRAPERIGKPRPAVHHNRRSGNESDG